MDLINNSKYSNGSDPFFTASDYTGYDIVQLGHELHRKQLFLNSQRESLVKLKDDLSKSSDELFKLSWVNGKKRLNIDQLLACGPDQNPGLHCLQAITLDNVVYKDAHLKLSCLAGEFSELLLTLRARPDYVALLLMELERYSITNLPLITSIIMSTLYGDCLLPEDQRLVLTLLKDLLTRQIASCDNPRRLLRQGSCAFYRVYKSYIENIRPAKLFLINALREPIMSVLIDDDSYLEIDPDNPQIKFTPEHRSRHPIHESNLDQNCELMVFKLTTLVAKFIESIDNNLTCFPDDLRWLIKQLYSSLSTRQRNVLKAKEISITCYELVFADFICHAIINPEQYGIVDTYISDVARFNLMQIAQIIQSLVMNDWDHVESKYKNLCSKIPSDNFSKNLGLIFLKDTSSHEPFPPVYTTSCDISRTALFITEPDLYELLSSFFNLNKICFNNSVRTILLQLITKIPESTYAEALGRKSTIYIAPKNSDSNEEVNLSESSKLKRGLLKRVTRRKNNQDQRNCVNSSSGGSTPTKNSNSPNIINSSLHASSSSIPSLNSNDDQQSSSKAKNDSDTLQTEVLIFNLPQASLSTKVSLDLSTNVEKLINLSETDNLDEQLETEVKTFSHILSCVDIQTCDISVNQLKDIPVESEEFISHMISIFQVRFSLI